MALDRPLESSPQPDPLRVAMAKGKPDRAALEARLGHVFADPTHLDRALTHVSAAAGEAGMSNQRLEFLGDRVLGLAVSEMLYAAHPGASEGELSHRLSELVRRETCAALATDWDLGAHLRLGSGEGRSGGRRNRATLADAAEAVLGAVFLDGGYPAAQAVVARALPPEALAVERPQRDAKTALQEWAQAAALPTPTYAVVDRSGPDHAPSFTIEAQVEGMGAGVGSGPSKRSAEQKAAESVLLREGVWPVGGAERAV